MSRLWHFARATVSIAIGIAVLSAAGTEVLTWLRTGNWPGFTLLDLVENSIGEPVLTAPWRWQALHGIQQLVRWPLQLVPASLFGLLVCGWAAWKLFPGRRSPGPSRAQTTGDVKAEARRIGGESVVVVSRHRPKLFESLRAEFRGNPLVHVLMDRRWGPNRIRRNPRDPERRQRDRRQGPDWNTAGLGSDDVVVARRVPGEQARPDGPETAASDKETR